MNILVTGGAGLVGSQMCETLLGQGAQVLCVDNFSLGTKKHLQDCESKSGFEFVETDVSKPNWWKKFDTKKFDTLIHLAANSDISLGRARPEMDYERTFQTTFETLQGAKALKIPNFIFASTSAVYGENQTFPTPELTAPMYPISVYGSGKLASEAYISAYVNNYGMNAWVYRFGNVVGKKLTHGVIYDFIQRLKSNPTKLEVLGNGTQNKTYIEVSDCVSGILLGFEKSKPGKTHAEKFQVFNLSTQGATTVKDIAQETVKIVTSGKAKIQYGEESIGWVGDVPKTSLNVERIEKLGFRPKFSSNEAVFHSIKTHFEWVK